MSDLNISNGLNDQQIAPYQMTVSEFDMPTLDQILYGIEPTLLSVQEISAKVGIMYDKAMWLLRRYIHNNGESTDRTLFASFFESCTNEITKNLRERKFDKVIERLVVMTYSTKKLNGYEPETAKFIFPEGVDEAIESLELCASSIKALSKIEG
jgi:hypothetical protein